MTQSELYVFMRNAFIQIDTEGFDRITAEMNKFDKVAPTPEEFDAALERAAFPSLQVVQ